MSPPNWIPPGLQSPAALATPLQFPASSGPSQLPPVFLYNPFESGISGTNISTANSAGPGANAFDVVTIGASATVAYDSSVAAHGGLSCKIATGATSTKASLQWSNNSVQNQTQIWYRFYLYLTAIPATSTLVFSINTLANVQAGQVKITTAGKLQVADSVGTATTAATVLPLNQWVRVEGFFIGSAAAGQSEIKLFTSPDSSAVIETNTSTAVRNTLGPIGIAIFGIPTNAANIGPYWLDDVAISNTGYIGPVGAESSPQPAAVSTPPGFMSPMTLAKSLQFPASRGPNPPPQTEFTSSPSATFTPPGLMSPMVLQHQIFYPSAPQQVPPAIPQPAPALSLPPPGMQSPMALAKPAFFSSASQVAANVNITGVAANVNVTAPAGSIAIYSAPSVQFPQAPALPEPLNFIPAFIGLRQQYTIIPLVPVPGSSAGVNVNAQFSDSTLAIYTINNPQQPFSPQLPPSLQFNPSSFALRQQYSTATPDVFAPGSAVNVNVAAPSGTATEFIDGVGQAANVNVSAPAGSINIYQTEFQPFPVLPLLPKPFNLLPPYIGLRQQVSTALPDVFVPGSVANINVSGQFADEIVAESIIGITANINAVAPAGSLSIVTYTPPQYPFPPVLPNVIQFNSSYIGLRQQYNTAFPGVFVTGTSSNVSVSGQVDNSVTEVISGSTGTVTVNAIPGIAASPTTILGPTATVLVTASAGTLKYINNTTWWRVYRGYANWPTW